MVLVTTLVEVHSVPAGLVVVVVVVVTGFCVVVVLRVVDDLVVGSGVGNVRVPPPVGKGSSGSSSSYSQSP